MKKKVLHVSCGGLGHGGVSSVIFSIVENLSDRFEFGCVVFKKRCDQENRFQKVGSLYRINAYNDDGKRKISELLVRPFRLFFSIRAICKKGGYEVIHCHNDFDEGICLMAAKFANVSTRIAHSHTVPSLVRKGIVFKIVYSVNRALIRKYATHCIGCSELACKDYFGHNSNYKIIYNCINLDKYDIGDRLPHNGVNFIHVGRYTHAKNQKFAIDVFEKIHENLHDSSLMLVGYGEDEELLRTHVKEKKLDDCVRFLPGNTVDIASKYAEADYMIFPSISEGFGIVLIEAQAMGIMCYASDVIPKEADAGLLCLLNISSGAEAWANRIIEDINNKTSIKFDNKKIHEFGIEIISQKYNNLYVSTK